MRQLLICTLLLFVACSSDESSNSDKKTKPVEPTKIVVKTDAASAPAIVKVDAAASAQPTIADASPVPVPSDDAVEPIAEKPDEGTDTKTSDGPTNLKVLPKKWTTKKVNTYMKKMTRGLGVKCSYCHVKGDNADDSNKHKIAARSMLAMTRKLDRSYLGGKGKLTCFTCHKGKKEP